MEIVRVRRLRLIKVVCSLILVLFNYETSSAKGLYDEEFAMVALIDNEITMNIVIALFIVVVFLYTLIFHNIRDKRLIKTEKELKYITSSVHVGFVNFDLSSNYTISYASKGFYDMIGYGENDMLSFGRSLHALVHPLDLQDFLEIHKLDNKNPLVQKEIRLVMNHGKVLWTLMNGNYVRKKNGAKIISAVFVDITEAKKMNERINLEQERYRVATEISNDILFEYNVEDDVMIFANKFEELCGKSATIYNFSKIDLKRTDLIYHEDRGVFSEYLRALRSGQELIESEFRMVSVDKSYMWSHTKGKTIYDEDKRPIRVIGKIVNIDLHKKELQKLEYKAKRDPLTNVYNKGVTKELIDSFLRNFPNGHHMFMIIDIDDFKGINDKYGHHQGDKILTFVIGQIKKIFNTGEIIGRIGGDEFVVFIGNVLDGIAMKEKADMLQSALSVCYVDDFNRITISGSVGISQAPHDGSSYDELLMCADKALYTVKGIGKNGYLLYDCDTKPMNIPY